MGRSAGASPEFSVHEATSLASLLAIPAPAESEVTELVDQGLREIIRDAADDHFSDLRSLVDEDWLRATQAQERIAAGRSEARWVSE